MIPKKEPLEDTPSRIARLSVPEKVVICIDNYLLRRQSNNSLISLLRIFRNSKEKISVQPVEFSYLFFDKGESEKEIKPKLEHFHSEKDFQTIFRAYTEEIDETQPCDLGVIFQALVENFKLPDASFFSDERPPPFVIHVVLIFGRNLFVPKLSEPNCAFFFAKNPFFTLDVLYLHDGLQQNKQTKITAALQVIAKTCSGYFQSVDRNKVNEIQSVLNEFLGHPLLRSPQDSAIYKIDVRDYESV